MYDEMYDAYEDDSTKLIKFKDEISTLKAERITAVTEANSSSTLTAPEKNAAIRDANRAFMYRRDALLKASDKADVSIEGIDTRNEIDSDTDSAIGVKNEELKRRIRDTCDSEEEYLKIASQHLRDHPTMDRSCLLDEDQERHLIDLARKERDDFIAHQQQSEPMDLWDPDT